MPNYRLERPTINGRQSAVWFVVWSENRRSYRLSTRTTDVVKARGILQRYAIAQAAPPERFTIADLADAYLKTKQDDPRIAYPKAIANSLKHIKAHFGGLPPSMVSRATVRGYISQRRKQVEDSTIDKELRFLRQALKFGVAEGWMAIEPKIETPGPGAARERFLTRAEFAALYFHASPLHLRLFLALAISTAQRGKHILALTWDRVDFDAGMIRYAKASPTSKKRTAQIPMNGPLRTALLQANPEGKRKTGPVIEWNDRPVKSVRKAYERAARLAGLEDAHRHDLRRTAASWAVQDGRSFEEVATMLGDTVETTRKHYAMFSPSYLRGVVNSISGARA